MIIDSWSYEIGTIADIYKWAKKETYTYSYLENESKNGMTINAENFFILEW